MKHFFEKIDHHLYRVRIDTDYTNFLDVLETSAWKKIPSPLADYLTVDSIDEVDVKKPLLDYQKFVKSDQFQSDLILHLLDNEVFTQLHKEDYHSLMQKTYIRTSWIRTPANYLHHFAHRDSDLYAHGLIYMINGNDANQSTYFSKYDDSTDDHSPPDKMYPMETGMGVGWLVVACSQSWHHALNSTDHARYCLKFSLDLVPTDSNKCWTVKPIH